MEAKAGRAQDLGNALTALRAAVIKLPGSLGVELLQDMDKPEYFYFLERWESQEAHGAAGKLLPADVMNGLKACLGAPPNGVNLRPTGD
jgi:hypothetical protein